MSEKVISAARLAEIRRDWLKMSRVHVWWVAEELLAEVDRLQGVHIQLNERDAELSEAFTHQRNLQVQLAAAQDALELKITDFERNLETQEMTLTVSAETYQQMLDALHDSSKTTDAYRERIIRETAERCLHIAFKEVAGWKITEAIRREFKLDDRPKGGAD
jgi:ribonucleotide reductase beta subunit family protein with ferritin-like domain